MTNRKAFLATCKAELYSAVVADMLDGLGHRNQVVAPGLSALDESMSIFGFARVGLYMPIYHDDEKVNVYEHEIRLVDDLKDGDVPIISCNGDRGIAPWGELLSTRAQVLGSAGCITDGSVRDVHGIRQMGYSVFSGGRFPADTKYRGKMMWMDVPCVIGGVRVNSGDMVVADADGIVFIPADLVEQVTSTALEKVRAENTVRDELRAGATLEDVFARYGIL